jgi:radical SAM-linked protein
MSQQRLRITFAKGTALKYISHLDLTLAWERTLRRAEVPLAYSQGYNPQAKLQLASGLPLGYIGNAEVMDVMLTESMPPQEFIARVRASLPSGLSITTVEEVPTKSPSLQSMLRKANYRVTVETVLLENELTRRINSLLAAEHLEQQRVRKGRAEVFDLRTLVHDVRLESAENGHIVLWMQLSAGQHGNVRPDAVLTALDLGDASTQVERAKLFFEFDRS